MANILCKDCGEYKPPEQFSRHSTGSRRKDCKSCRNHKARKVRRNPVVMEKTRLINWRVSRNE